MCLVIERRSKNLKTLFSSLWQQQLKKTLLARAGEAARVLCCQIWQNLVILGILTPCVAKIFFEVLDSK